MSWSGIFTYSSFFQCSHFICVFRKSDLLNKDNTIDIIKVYIHLNAWIEKYPAFTDAVDLVKDECVDNELPVSHPCPSKFLASCMVTTIGFVSIL